MGRVGVALVLALVVPMGFAAGAAASARPLTTALFAPGIDLTKPGVVEQMTASGVTAIRLMVNWASVAPTVTASGFDAADSADPQYRWGPVDAAVQAATDAGLQPIIDVADAPAWAQDGPPKQYYGPVRPHAADLAAFAHAIATRYSGAFDGLPRVRDWMFWNEPNLVFDLRPQFEHGQAVSPAIYRTLLNTFADEIHGVHPDNTVIAGATAPFTSRTGATADWGVAPLTFMRNLLCLSKKLEATCKARVKFDVWAHHPYTSGGPSHHANLPNDVSLGDLPEMRAVLQAGVRSHHVVSRHAPQFWVTEFSWDTNPPDPKAVPIGLQSRWVAEALETMWRAGVSLVTWFTLQDDPMSMSPYQSGLYFADGKPKPTLTAFRFPFVVRADASRLHVWARTPAGAPGTITVQLRQHGWRTVARLHADRYGIVDATIQGRAGVYRGIVAGEASLSFATREPPDHFYPPFGS